MATRIASLYAEVSADTTKFERGMRQARGDMQDFGRGVGKGGGGLMGRLRGLSSGFAMAGAAVAAVGTAAVIAYKQIDQGAQLDLARNRFENLAESINTTADALLNDMREATSGMMADSELIASASQIISLGLANNEEDVTRLATVIGTLGLDMQQVIMTFANNSVMRLDALGLSVEDVTTKAKELEEQGFQGDAFDEAVLIALEEKMQLLGDTADTTAGHMQILKASVQNVKDEVALFFRELAAPAIEDLANSTEIGRKAIRNQAIEIARASDNWKEFIPAIEEAFGADVWDNAVFRMENGMGAFIDLGNGVSIAVDELDNIIDKTDDYIYSLDELSRAGRQATQENKEWAAATEAAAADMVLLKDITHSADNAATDYNLTLEELAQLGRSKLPEAVDNVNEKLMEQELAAIRAEEEMRELNDRMGDYFDSAINATGPAESLTSMLYDAGLAAGLGAEDMAILAAATGEFTEAQIEAALKTAFMTEQIRIMAQAIDEDFTVEDAVGALGLLEEGLATSADEAMRLWEEMNKIPPEVNSRVVVTYKTDKSEWLPPPDAPPTNWGGPSGAGQNDGAPANPDDPNTPRAMGGPVFPNSSYLVGERGPEIFVPNTAGQIVPNDKIGGHTINIYVTGGGRGAQHQAQQIATAVTDALGRLN